MNLRKEFESKKFNDILKQNLKEECVNCESNFNIQYHHIVPLTLGGTNKISNIVPLCEDCHNKIHNIKNMNMKQLILDGIESMPIVNGKKVSKKTGRPTGRPNTDYPIDFEIEYNKWKLKKQNANKTMQNLGLKRTTFYKLVKEYELSK